MVDKKKVAILGVTGAVGHRFAQLLGTSPISTGPHPYFDLEVITGSSRSAGKMLQEVWRYDHIPDMPYEFSDMKIERLDPEDERGLDGLAEKIDIAFSALPKETKEGNPLSIPIEVGLAKRGVHVFSNAGTMRMSYSIPLIVAPINGSGVTHYMGDERKVFESDFNLINKQRWYTDSGGFIVKNPNCSTIALAITLAPLLKYDLEEVIVDTQQAESGAGFDAYDRKVIDRNLHQNIPNEAYKIETELVKILHLKPLQRNGEHSPIHKQEQFVRKYRADVYRFVQQGYLDEDEFVKIGYFSPGGVEFRGKLFNKIKEGKISKETFMGSDLAFPKQPTYIKAMTSRINVADGHEEKVHVRTYEEFTPKQIENKWRNFDPLKKYNLPTSPDHPILIIDDMLKDPNNNLRFENKYDSNHPKDLINKFMHPNFRPQPLLDAYNGRGMTITIGQIDHDVGRRINYALVGHNTIAGAAGASVLNAELFYTLKDLGKLKV